MTTEPQIALPFTPFFKPCAQFKRVAEVMESGSWMTLAEIEQAVWQRFVKRDSQGGIGARIRQFKFMGYEYEKRVREGYESLYEYRRIA